MQSQRCKFSKSFMLGNSLYLRPKMGCFLPVLEALRARLRRTGTPWASLPPLARTL